MRPEGVEQQGPPSGGGILAVDCVASAGAVVNTEQAAPSGNPAELASAADRVQRAVRVQQRDHALPPPQGQGEPSVRPKVGSLEDDPLREWILPGGGQHTLR